MPVKDDIFLNNRDGQTELRARSKKLFQPKIKRRF